MVLTFKPFYNSFQYNIGGWVEFAFLNVEAELQASLPSHSVSANLRLFPKSLRHCPNGVLTTVPTSTSGLGEAQNVETSFFFTEQRASRKPEIKTVSKSWSKWQWKSQGHQFPQTSSICQNLIKIKWKTSLLKEDIQLRDVWGASKGYFHTKKLIVCPLKTSVSLENQWADTCPLLSNFFL